MKLLGIGRRVLGRVLLILGHVLAIALAVAVPIVIVVFSQDILRTTLVSLALMLAIVALVIGGDRLIGYRKPFRPARATLSPPEAAPRRPFMLAGPAEPAPAPAEEPRARVSA